MKDKVTNPETSHPLPHQSKTAASLSAAKRRGKSGNAQHE
jgi:hypothetical protein